MTLEEKINEILKQVQSPGFTITDIRHLSLETVIHILFDWDNYGGNNLLDFVEVLPQINYEIQNTPLSICLTSPSDYIRKYRQEFEEKGQVDNVSDYLQCFEYKGNSK